MIRNEYYLKARLMPTVLTMIPLVVLYLYIVAPLIDPVLKPVWNLLPVFTGVSINVAVMFLLVLLNRFLSKAIFQRLFYQDDLKMPTTDFLLPNNPALDNISRERYYSFILTDFGIDMKKSLKALKSENDKRIMIARVVGQIREMMRDNKMILQHNIEYGFFRNLLGGCVVASIISVSLLIIALVIENRTLLITSIVTFVIYILPIVFSKLIVKIHGANYAKVLFEQYGVKTR